MIKPAPFSWLHSLPIQVMEWFTELVAALNTALSQLATALTNITSLQNSVSALPAIAAQNNVKGTTGHSLGSAIHNTNAKPMFVNVSGSYVSGASAAWAAYSDSNSTPTTQVAADSSSGSGGYQSNLAFWVLPGNYYMVSGNLTISSWTEWV